MFKFVFVIMLAGNLSLQDESHVIGILTLEVKGSDKDTYFYTSYAKWLEQNNV